MYGVYVRRERRLSKTPALCYCTLNQESGGRGPRPDECMSSHAAHIPPSRNPFFHEVEMKRAGSDANKHFMARAVCFLIRLVVSREQICTTCEGHKDV